MDDDIDIEEHDVLDNPRIKSIFPDLSRVKLEIPDDEDIIDEDQYGMLEPEEEPQEMQYQYDYSFESVPDEIPQQVYSLDDDIEETEETEDYVVETTNYDSRNAIILGSKPDLEVLYEEALNSHPVVFLENWKARLKSSPCFCDTCDILFPTVNALDAHKMISHSYLVALETPQRNTARKSTVPSKYCNHCSKTFPDDTSLIKHLYELLPLNKFPQVKEEKEPEKGKKLATPVPWPKKVKSPSHVISKLQPKKIKIEPKQVKIEPVLNKDIKPKLKSNMLSRDGKFFAASSLVPKSTLFLCNVCQVGFLSCFSACQHSKHCKSVLTFEKCGICKRKIRTKDVKTHELQHTYNDKLKIYTMNKTIYERVLCKCPKCLSCFDELAFWAHYQKCKKSDKKSIYCPDCDVNISSLRYKSHQMKHSTKKLTRKDFIIIEFYDQKIHSQKIQRMNTENKAELMKHKRRERQKIYRARCRSRMHADAAKKKENGITLYYCEFCGCCQFILNYKGHTDGSCKDIASKKYCEKCGLCFTAKSVTSHLALHEKHSFTLKDINIINLSTGKYIEPPMSEYYECKSCLKNFIYNRALNIHDCKTEKYITCKVCMKKFNIQAYKIHKLFHSVDKLMPELMKKYNLINSMWNVMYMCVSCELITMTYDSAVTHSQGHLNYIISDLHKQCVVCDLKIAEKEFDLHEKLHTNNESIERESFKILKYNHDNLFKKEWLTLFKELPKEHRQQILSKSIYRFTRSVKMQIEISASTDDETKYFCMNCNSFVAGTFIKQHILSKCPRSNVLTCSICHVPFKTQKLYLSHMGTHQRQTIVTFNNKCDEEFNNHLSLIESKSRKSMKDVPLSKLRDLLLSDTAKTTYKLYKCARCQICVTLRSSARRHRCVPGSKKRFCVICEQYFCARKGTVHFEAHRKKPYINKDSFFIIHFNDGAKPVSTLSRKEVVTPKVSPKKETPVKVSPRKLVIAKIYECQCGLHFTSMKTVEKHLDECSPELEVSKETCSKCKLLFPTDVLVTHLINHHHKETRIVKEKVARADVLKCYNCAILFTNMYYFNAHIDTCFQKNGTHCRYCKLSFGMNCFKKHLCNSVDMTYINKVTVVRKKVVKQETVYRCTLCDITYLQRNSFRYHYYEIKHKLKKPPVKCETCGLTLTHCSFRKHVKIHRVPDAEYKIKVVDPITGGFVFLTGNNGVDVNIDSVRSPRKRRHEQLEEADSDSVKKAKQAESLGEIDQPLSERRMSRKVRDRPSTSRRSRIDFDETSNPDEISDHVTDNTSNVSNIDIDTSETTSPDKMNETLDKSGISRKLKSRILVDGYSKELFKCVHCNQHYMKESSFDYHVKTYSHTEKTENFECDICGIEFSRYTLPRHKYVHHDHMGLTKEDFVIRVCSAYSKEKELKTKSIQKTLDVSSEIRDDPEISEHDTKELNNVNVSGTCETETLSEDNVNDNCNSKELSDVNVSDNCDTEALSEDNVNDTCNSKELSDVNVSDNCDTEQLSDVNVNDISENNSELMDNISEIDKICYYKCSDCNVCYIDREMCYEHTRNHETLDPKSYIQCKICDFQFLIDSLKEHMVLHHHSDFRIQSLTIHEYKSSGRGEEPKVDIYQAVDKVQSRLVSTTTDVWVV